MNSRNFTKPIIPAVSLAFLASAFAGMVWAGEALTAEQIRARLIDLFPEYHPDHVERAPVSGMYQALYGGELLYITEDGRYLLREAELYDLEEMSNLSEQTRSQARARVLQTYGADKMVVFPAKQQRHYVTVVTDIDCPYCRKFHEHIGVLNRRGVEVRYLMYPRAGEGSDSYHKSVSVWCADDPLQAMTTAKRLQPIEARECANPVLEHMDLVEQIGIRSTPSIFLPDGSLIRGYRPPEELIAVLEGG